MLIYLLIVVFPIPYKDPGPPVYEYNVSGLSGIPKKEFTALPIWLNILPDSGVDSGWFVVGGFILPVDYLPVFIFLVTWQLSRYHDYCVISEFTRSGQNFFNGCKCNLSLLHILIQGNNLLRILE